MKINIWKLLLAALVVPAAMGACTDERNNFMVDDSVSFVDSDGDWQEFKTLPVYDEAYRFPVVKNGKGLSGATIYIETPDSVIDSYNKLNGTDFVALPAECYDFSTNELRFSKKEIRKFVDLTWNMDAISALDQTKNYVIPVLLTVAGDALPTSEDRDRMLIYPKFAFASMAQIATATSKGDLVYNGEITLDVPVTSENVEIGYEIDNSLIAAYNEKNGTDYKAAPAGLLALDAAASTISAGESSTNFSLRLSSSKLLEDISVLDEKYLIPVRMTSISNAARIGDESVSYVTVAQGTVKGPWTLLEGENNCYAKDPKTVLPGHCSIRPTDSSTDLRKQTTSGFRCSRLRMSSRWCLSWIWVLHTFSRISSSPIIRLIRAITETMSCILRKSTTVRIPSGRS